MTLRVLVADDEPLARRKIVRMLDGVPDVAVVGECGDGAATLEAVRTLQPDLMFLDIQMPGFDGFEVVRALGAAAPAIVFVTAFDEHALAAFDVAAVDYVLKPFARARLMRALEQARQRLRSARADDGQIEALLDAHADRTLQRFAVRTRNGVLLVPCAGVRHIEADGNYVRLHTATRSYLVRATLGGLAARLDPRRFVRVHRSHIVNREHVIEVVSGAHGDYSLRLDTGARVRASRRYHAIVAAWIAGDQHG